MSIADVIGIGIVAPNGPSAREAVFFTRAGRLLVRESPFVDRRGTPVGLATVSALPDELLGPARLSALASVALGECLRALPAGSAATLPLFLAVPGEPARASAAGLGGPAQDPGDRALLDDLSSASGGAVDGPRSMALRFGRAGGALALTVAASRLRQRQVPFVLVGGVDSHHDADRLDALDDAKRLHAEDVENGFLPGEGAAFLLLGPPGSAAPLARIHSVAVENEPRPLGSAEPCQGLAMTLAMQRALEDADLSRPIRVVSDIVEERHRVSEWLLASGRLVAFLGSSPEHEQPLLVTGDLGAASLPFLVAYVAGLFRACAFEDAPRSVLVLGSSDGEERGAVLVTAP